MEKKYTPGPWETAEDGNVGILHYIVGPRSTLVARTCYAPSSAANAALIAAAPDLLEALEVILGFGNTGEDMREAKDIARAAIAKATTINQ